MVGWREWISLPDLNIRRLKAKIDTGARSSALHADIIDVIERKSGNRVRFHVLPDTKADKGWICEHPITDHRYVMNSGGNREMRYFIQVALRLAGREWPIEVSLTARHELRYPMLLGREALRGRVLIDPARSWVTGRLPRKTARPKPKQKPR